MYIIDEVHMLSTSAFNALLKTLEEPPPHLIFVFATTEQHKVPATILSRCQRHEFRRMEIEKIFSHLTYIAQKEEIEIDNESLITIARKADGSMRDSQSIFDQVVAFSGKKVVYSEMVDALHLIDTEFFFRISQAGIDKNFEEMLLVAKDISNKGYDLQECLGGLLEHYRNLLTLKVTNKLDLIDAPDSFIEKYKKFSEYYSKSDLMRILNLISTTEQALRFTSQPKVKFELCLMNLAAIDNAVEISELLSELKSGKGLSQYNSTSVAKERSTSYTVSSSKLAQSSKPAVPSIKHEKTDNTILQVQPIKVDSTIDKVDKSDKISLEEGWQAFLDKYSKAEFGLQYLNQSYCNPVFLNQEIVLNASSQIIFENITNNKKNILHYLEVHFGHKISIKILQNDTGSSLPKDSIGDSSNTNNSTAGSIELNPLEQTIVNLFGAKVSPR
jgi:DNA polymerase-3 subunit gamma/tau